MLTTAVNLALNVSSLLFLIFMMIVYFSKKNMNNIDNTLYKLLLVFNFFNSADHVVYLLFQWFHIGGDFTTLSVVRSYWIPAQFYLVILVLYIIYTLRSDDKEFVIKIENNKRKYKYYLLGIFLIELLIFLFAPLKVYFDKDGYLSGFSGLAIYLYYIPFIFLLLLNAVAVILYGKKKDQKKILPFKVLLVFIIVGFGLNAIYPAFCITEFLVTIISYLMFHTIENPDLKLVNQLTLAKSEAEKASNAKSEFLSSMSHELRTPLNAIVGLSTMIKDESDQEEVRNDANDILKASNNLLDLVDGILDINKLDSNEMEVVNVNYNPLELFNTIEESMKIRVGEKQLEIRTRFSPELPQRLNGDKDKIKTIISNLLSNAVKYTEKGYIDFNVDCIINKDKCNLRITISDTGRGIRNDQKEFLFTKFYRLEEDKDSNIEGTGLGLAITKSLVDLLEGEITVNSTEGMGTTFMVTLTQKLVQEEPTTTEEIL